MLARMTWSSTFRRFPPGPMTVFGPVTLGVHDWAAPRPGQPQMFNHPFLEWFTGTRPRTLVLIFLPVSVGFVWAGLVAGWSPRASSLLFVGGVVLWTLLEYLMHRFVFHLTPRGRLGVLFAYLIHGVHHAFPEDRRRWLMPPIVTAPVATVLFFVLRLLVGSAAPPVFAGAVFGYLAYDLLHYASHAGALRGRVPRYLRQHHLTHHYRMPETRFGVSSPFWDRAFGTLR
ncbi:MAG: fatty acid hydroxylase [Candidatus Rokuibacteriota bacterium]|nr:MAG: fatty acid hydroxylase [Candidatus Rokubacteria bacterium]